MTSLHSFKEKLVPAVVVKRPSSTIKSPYVADVVLTDGDGRTLLCHTPGLGCGGMVEEGAHIYVTLRRTTTSKTQCTAILAECADKQGTYYVGLHPMISQACATKLLTSISPTASWESEVTIEEGTRIDFVGTEPLTGKKIYVEVKNAMLSTDVSKIRCDRRAIFPDGYRKKKDEPISPRAVKHAEVLGRLAASGEKCVLLYMIPRKDCCDGVEINEKDPIYYSAVQTAVRSGVVLRAFSLDFRLDGTIWNGGEVPFYIRF